MSSGQFPIVHEYDDGFYYSPSYFPYDGSSLYIGCQGACASAASTGTLRFQSVTIPQGSEITSAKLTGITKANSSKTVSVKVYFEAADDSAAFSTYAEIITRTWTNSWVLWEMPSSVTADTSYDSPDLIVPLQEVINRDGWASGQALTAFVTDYESTDHHYYDFYDKYQAVFDPFILTVEWGPPADEVARWNSLDMGENISLSGDFLTATHL